MRASPPFHVFSRIRLQEFLICRVLSLIRIGTGKIGWKGSSKASGRVRVRAQGVFLRGETGMFRLLSRSQTKRAARPLRRASLGVEALEARHCLTGPSLTLTTQVLPNHMVQLSGVLTDNFFPGGVPVRFSGAVTGSTMTDWGGHYSFWTPNASLGSVSASA